MLRPASYRKHFMGHLFHFVPLRGDIYCGTTGRYHPIREAGANSSRTIAGILAEAASVFSSGALPSIVCRDTSHKLHAASLEQRR